MSRTDFPKIYNPANQTPKELIENFVVRTKIFEEILADIKNSEMKHPEQHYIIQGVRGQGKTTLLLRIAYEIDHDKKLRRRIIPIIFNEEQYNISRLFKLWETIAEYLAETGDIPCLYDEMQKFENDDDYEWRCLPILENALKKHKKKMILFIDNIDEILIKFTKKEHHRLREVFTESAELRIIGASSVSLEFHYDYGKPFYQFFRMPELKGLNAKETKTLLLSLGQQYKKERVKDIVENQSGRVEALRRMTNGVIRTIIILFAIFVDDENGNAFMDLEKVMDSVTPLYKHRMDKLSSQQQEIIDFIALNWDAVSTKEISKKTKLASKAVSSQLKQLEKFHIIEKEKTDTKNYLYRISERFFNTWYLMRLGRKWDERRVRFLVEFLQVWCDEEELETRARKHLQALKKGKLYEKQALYMTEALGRMPLKRELQHQLIVKTRNYLEDTDSELKDYLTKSDHEINEIAQKALQSKNYDTVISQLEQIKIKNPGDLNTLGVMYWTAKRDKNNAKEYFLESVKKENPSAMYNLANLYRTEFKDFKKAEKYYLMAVEKEHSRSMYNLAKLYRAEFKNFEKVEKYYLMAVEKEDSRAMYNLALLYETESIDIKKAEKYYLMAVTKGHSEAMYNLALLYETESKNIKKAEKYYLMAAAKEHSKAMHNLASLYQTDLKDFKKAEKYYLMAVERGLTYAMDNLASLYWREFKNFKKAEQYYLMSVEQEVPDAMYNLASLYYEEFKDFKKAEKFYLMAVEREHPIAMNNLANLYETKFKDIKRAEKYYLMAVEKEDSMAMNNLAVLYFEEKIHQKEAIEYIEQSYKKDKNNFTAHTYSMILLWHNEIKKAYETAKDFFNDSDLIENIPEDVSQLMMMFIAKKQYHIILKIFNENPHHLKDRFKPIYYALMYFMQKEYPNEFRKMGSELKQTVAEIIEKIHQLAKDYA